MSQSTSIAVLLRTFNSAKTLDRVISRLDLVEGDEVIVVDSGSTDATLDIARKHGAKIEIAEGKFNYSKSLNIGFRAASTPWVLVLSSHSIPVGDMGLLAAYRAEMVNFPPDVWAAYGVGSLTGQPLQGLDPVKAVLFSWDDFDWASGIGGNPNALYRRSAWETLPFDEEVRTGEDLIWKKAIVKQGQRVAYVPRARTQNQNRGSLRYMFDKGRGEMRAFAAPGQVMLLRHLAGAIKNHTLIFLRGEINGGTFVRACAHAFGQFVGSRQERHNRR